MLRAIFICFRNQNQQHEIPEIELALPAAALPLVNDIAQFKVTKIGDNYFVTTCDGPEMSGEILESANLSDPMPSFINDYDNKISVPGKYVFPTETPTFIIDDNQLVFNTGMENIICLQNGANVLDNLTNSSDTDYYITLDNGRIGLLKGQATPNQPPLEETRNGIFIQENKQTRMPDVQSPLKRAQKATKNKTSKAPASE